MPSELASHWTLDPSVTFLNHGSFGATPRAVLEEQQAWRDRMEREPVAFFARDLEPALDAARAELAGFLGADPDDLAFVHNATTAINIVARSLRLEPGDEIVVLDHEYNAARNAMEAATAAAGARVVTAALPFPGVRPDDPLAALLAALSPRTRLVLVDHVTSPTALALPVREIVGALRERGIDTLVDAAHAPGMVVVDLDATGAAYTAGNCHKWLNAPKGSAFLHVRRERQELVRPLVISHGANSPRTDRSRFRLEHDWTGTLDPTAWLAVPAAIRFGATLVPGGWTAIRERGHRLALEGRDLLCATLGIAPPAADRMIGSMASVPLPGGEHLGGPPTDVYADPVHAALLAAGIQVAIARWPMQPGDGPWRRLVRFSCAPYTDRQDLEQLASALADVLAAA
jgi:isopenicillin-N epimerase